MKFWLIIFQVDMWKNHFLKKYYGIGDSCFIWDPFKPHNSRIFMRTCWLRFFTTSLNGHAFIMFYSLSCASISSFVDLIHSFMKYFYCSIVTMISVVNHGVQEIIMRVSTNYMLSFQYLVTIMSFTL